MLRNLLLILILVFSCIAIGFLVGDYLYANQRFGQNTYIESIDVSGLTVGEAINKLKAADVDAACLEHLTLVHSSEGYEYAPSQIGAFIKPRDTAYKAFARSYEPSYLKGLFKRLTGKDGRIVLPFMLGLDVPSTEAVLKEIASGIDIPAIEARCVLLGNGRYRLLKEKIGYGVYEGETISLLKDTLARGGRSSPLVVKDIVPRVLKKDLTKYPPTRLIATYKTRYGIHDSPNRIHNIKLLSGALDNYIILSGETFSLLGAMGDINKDRGFKEAFVIINGELVPQYGGGACQIATTLYNAAMMADLGIEQRRNHAIYFHIYPLGRDAAVYSGGLDLKVLNDLGRPIMLKAAATDLALTLSIYGTPIQEKASFSAPKIYLDGGKEVSREAFAFNLPFRTAVVRTVSVGGKAVKTETIRSYYKNAGEGANTRIVTAEPE